jgi:hypothetical protein
MGGRLSRNVTHGVFTHSLEANIENLNLRDNTTIDIVSASLDKAIHSPLNSTGRPHGPPLCMAAEQPYCVRVMEKAY